MDMSDTVMMKIIQDNQLLDLTNKSQATSMIEMRNSLASLSIPCKFCRQPVSAFDLLQHWKPHLDLDPTVEMDADTISILDRIHALTELEDEVKEQALFVKATHEFIAANTALGQLDEAAAMMKIIQDNQQLDLTNKSQTTSMIEMRNLLATLSITCKFCRQPISAFDVLEHWSPHLDLDPTLEMDADMISILDQIRSFKALEAAVNSQTVIVKSTNDYIAAKQVKCTKCDKSIYATGISSHLDAHLAAEAEEAENAVLGQLGDTAVDELFDKLIATPPSLEHQISIAEHHDAYHEMLFGNLSEDENMVGHGLLSGPTAPNTVAQAFQPLAAGITHDGPQQFKNDDVWIGIDDLTGDLFVAEPMVAAQHHPVPPVVVAAAAAEGQLHAYLPEPMAAAQHHPVPLGVVAAAAAEGQPHAYHPEPMAAAQHHPVPPGVVAAAEGQPHAYLPEPMVAAQHHPVPPGVVAAAAAEGQPHANLPELAAPRVLAGAPVGQQVDDHQQSA